MIPALVDGLLPLGRWPATVSEIQAWDTPDKARRSKLLSDWQQLTAALQEATASIAASWLSGSFFSDKDSPNDLDVVYWVHNRLLDSLDEDGQRFVSVVNSDGARRLMGLEIDARVLSWWPRPGVHRGSDVRMRGYLEHRGYWDDLWSRQRDSDPKVDKLLRRGYVEVIHDGYQEPAV